MRWSNLLLLLLLPAVTGCDTDRDRGGVGSAPGPAEKDVRRLDRIAVVYQSGETERAAEQLEEYTRDFPRDDLAWTILGNAYEDLDRNEEAGNAYDRALEINPKRFEAITGRGILHRKRGEYDAAMQAYERAVELDPTYAQAYSSMTTIALKQNDDAKALEYAKKGYELDSTDPVIAANLAVAYHFNDDFEHRDEMKQRAADLGYRNLESLEGIFSGELTIRDE